MLADAPTTAEHPGDRPGCRSRPGSSASLGTWLVCSSCAARSRLSAAHSRCRSCGGRLDVCRDVADARPDSGARTLLGRYRALLPFGDESPAISLGEGGTPLLAANSLGSLLGLGRLFFKLESRNPTGSSADRGSVAAVRRALDLGSGRVGVVATGGLAGSTAAYAARAGLGCVVLCPSPPVCPVDAASAHGARCIQVGAPYEAVCAASLRAGPRSAVYFLNRDDPFRAEGHKTLAFEVAEQTPEGPPDYVVIATAGGTDAAALAKGFREWRRAGLADAEPEIVEVSRAGADLVVDEREVRAAQQLLAHEEGLSVSADGAAAFAGLIRAARAGRFPSDGRLVVVLTGHARTESDAAELGKARPSHTTLRGLARALADPAPSVPTAAV